MSITSEDIKQHIINVVKNENKYFIDKSIIEDYKNKITSGKEYDELDYIAKIFIDDMDRNLLNIEKSNFDIMKVDLSSLVQYLDFNSNKVLNEHINKYLVEAVQNKIYEPFGFGENINEILGINGLISAIVRDIHIYNLVVEAERINNAKKRDSIKIKNAVETLLQYTNDEQVKYYLNRIEVQTRDITISTVQSCIFCNIYKICDELFSYSMNKSEILSLSKDIMLYVFNATKKNKEDKIIPIDYRPYSEIEIIKYKGYKLRMFKDTKKKSN